MHQAITPGYPKIPGAGRFALYMALNVKLFKQHHGIIGLLPAILIDTLFEAIQIYLKWDIIIKRCGEIIRLCIAGRSAARCLIMLLWRGGHTLPRLVVTFTD